MVKWQERLNTAVQRWAQRWQGSDGAPRAELGLVFEEDGRFIGLVMDIESRPPDFALRDLASATDDAGPVYAL